MRWSLLLLLLLATQVMADACRTGATPIAAVQGRGTQSPLLGRTVTVEGILTHDSRHSGGFRGFYLQQAAAETDDDPTTSDALFVFTDRKTGQPGDRVRVTGTVREYHGLTEIAAVQTLRLCGQGPMPPPVRLSHLWPGDRAPEHLEAMRVSFIEPLIVVENHNLHRYGELTLAPASQPAPTQVLSPGAGAAELLRQQQRQRLHLDDNRATRYPESLAWPAPAPWSSYGVRSGTRISGLTGILDYRFDGWRLQPQQAPVFHPTNPRAAAVEQQVAARPAGSNLRVLSLNLHNFFNGNGRDGGFPTARGAETGSQFADQRRRLVAALTAPDPDVIALSELENDGYGEHSAIAELAQALGQHWRFVRAGAEGGSEGERNGGDAIRNGLLFRADRIVPVSTPQQPGQGIWAGLGRPPLAQAFRPAGGGQAVRIVAVHLKSKSCRGASGANRDQQDGQGCYARRRERAAQTMIRWLDSLTDPGGLAGTLVTGDLNAYARETAITRFTDAGYTDLLRHFQGDSAYTYRYRGRSGTLDYSLASTGLADRVLQTTSWRINADESADLDYRGAVAVTGPWRSSDHDPLITDLAL